MASEMNVNNSYVRVHDYFGTGNKKITGKCDYVKDTHFLDVGMFSRGQTNDGRKWVADDGKIFVDQKDGSVKKERWVTFDKDNDGIADEKYKVRTLQNGKIKAHKTRWNSERVGESLAKINSIQDVDKKERKLAKLRRKLEKAGVSQEAINNRFNIQKTEISKASLKSSFDSKKFLLSQTENLKPFTPTKELRDENSAEARADRIQNLYSDAVAQRKSGNIAKAAISMVKFGEEYEKERKNQRVEAQRLLNDPNLQKLYEEQPKVLEALYSILNTNA